MAKKTADERQQGKMDRYNAGNDRSWMKYKDCEFCGKQICINNYDDRRPRTPKFKGLVICPWCNPYSPSGQLIHPELYKTLISRVLVEILAKRQPHEEDGCMECKARKITKVGVE